MNIGFNKQLYVLPFDHRGSFQTKMFGWDGPLTPEQAARIAASKHVIYDGFKRAVTAGVPREKAAILVDEQFGAAILRDAADHGFITACPAEKSARDEFDFEYGEDFGRHTDAFSPTFCKVLVRYNPEGDQGLNKVREWLSTAAQVAGFIGFAVGRTVFWSPLVDWLARKTTREAAVAEIARRYRGFVDIFENNLYLVKAGG